MSYEIEKKELMDWFKKKHDLLDEQYAHLNGLDVVPYEEIFKLRQEFNKRAKAIWEKYPKEHKAEKEKYI